MSHGWEKVLQCYQDNVAIRRATTNKISLFYNIQTSAVYYLSHGAIFIGNSIVSGLEWKNLAGVEFEIFYVMFT